MTRDEMIEHEREFSRMVLQARKLQRQLTRAQWAHDTGRAAEVADQLTELGPRLRYAQAYWECHGQWSRYWRVPGGAVHTTILCRTINAETAIEPLVDLAARSLQIVAESYRTCRHCSKIQSFGESSCFARNSSSASRRNER